MASLEQYGSETLFNFNGVVYQVEQTAGKIAVAQGVVRDTYQVKGMEEVFDLGIVRVSSGCKTPRQKVLKGKKTVEGILNGIGTFEVVRKLPENSDLPTVQEVHYVDIGRDADFMQIVKVGDEMQWCANADVPLEFYELCWPPRDDTRFRELPD